VNESEAVRLRSLDFVPEPEFDPAKLFGKK
jgi:hypothetical protein